MYYIIIKCISFFTEMKTLILSKELISSFKVIQGKGFGKDFCFSTLVTMRAKGNSLICLIWRK